jgi:DNA excision repair protein ERCC-5
VEILKLRSVLISNTPTLSIFQAKRAQSKSKIQSEAERLEQLLLETLAKEKIVKQALGDPEKLLISPSKLPKPKPTREEERDEMFMLPAIEGTKKEIKSELDEDEEELCPKRAYDVNINRIDVNSTHFKSLPADIRHDILTDIKETRKQNTWARLRELPVESNDFSTYQMSRLLRRRQVQVGLEEAEKEMGGKTFSLTELESLLSEDGVLEVSEKCAQKISSDENTRFLLVRDIAKAMQEAKTENVAGPSTSEPKPSTSKTEVLDDDEDLELQRAIQMSLGNDPDPEPEVPSDGRVKMNQEQRQKFGGTIQAHGLIRGFMMEYAEMNDDDIQDMVEQTQVEVAGDLNDSFREKFPNTDDYVLFGTPKKNQSQTEVGVISDSEDEATEKKNDESLVIEVATDGFKPEEDLFADVFESKKAEEVPDVEVASISSDDDTLPYEIPKEDFEEISKETESGFVSEVQERSPDESIEEVAGESENDKFWSVLSEPVKVAEKIEEDREESVKELSENEKFWGTFDDLPMAEVPEANGVSAPLMDQPEDQASAPKQPTEEAEDQVEVQAPPEVPSRPETSPEAQETLPQSSKDPSSPTVSSQPQLIAPSTSQTTPKKPRDYSPPPAKVASPFFVNRKTPKSKEKSAEPSTSVPTITIAKNLFPGPSNLVEELQATKTHEELESMKDELANQQRNLAQERNKLDRQGTSITDSMSQDCKNLLKLFGIPFITSPMEAEAQCAFLNMIQLTDGTISDDSDIWLFGGQTVYKNFFVQKKMVMEFSNENIEKMFHLDRKKLIQLAMLVGSDYTVGISGIGAVTALEILAAFPETEDADGATDQYQSLVSSLRKFREWFNGGKQVGAGGKTVLKSKLKNVELIEGFPNINVAKAYLEPIVDQNAEKFSWGMPDSESLIEYAKAKLGWTRMKTEEILAPVMKRLNEKKQATIKDYFKSQVTKKFFETGKMSKRVKMAVGKMGGEEEEVEEKKPKERKRKATVKKAGKKKEAGEDEAAEPSGTAAVEASTEDEVLVILSDDDDDDNPPPAKKVSPEKPVEAPKATKPRAKPKEKAPKSQPSTDDDSHFFKKKPQRKRKAKDSEPSTSAAALEADLLPPKRSPRIPETKQIIPQREKDKEEREKAKQKAIEIFKNSKKSK